MSDEEKAKGQAVLEALISTLREGQARSKPGELTVISAHVRAVTDATVQRLGGKATRADVLEAWLMWHLHAALRTSGEKGEPVLVAAGDA